MTVYPKDWDKITLGHYGEIVTGGTPNRNNPAYWGGDILWVTPSEITNIAGKYLHDTQDKITVAGLNASAAKMLPENSLLVTSRATVGEVALSANPISTNQGFKSIVPNRETNPHFAFHQIQTLQQSMVRFASGTTFLEILKGDFSRLPVHRPKLPEQGRIAYVLDTIDQSIASAKALVDKLAHVRAGVLHDLMNRHADTWKRGALGELAFFQKGRKVAVTNQPRDGYLPYIGAEVISGGPVSEFASTIGAVIVSESDVLMLWDGERSGLVGTGMAGVASSTVAKLTPKPNINGRFLCHALSLRFGWIQARRTGTGVPHVSKDLAEILRLDYPADKSEQARIASAIDTIDDAIASVLAELNKLQYVKSGVRDDLLTGRIRVPETMGTAGSSSPA